MLHMGLVGAVIVQVASQVIMTVWMAWRVNRAAPLHLRWNGKLARGMLAFGSKSYVQTLAATLHLRIDQYICAYFLPPAQVGMYAIAVNFGSLLLKIPEATGTVMFARMAGCVDRGDHAAATLIHPPPASAARPSSCSRSACWASASPARSSFRSCTATASTEPFGRC